jgi:cation transport regulator
MPYESNRELPKDVKDALPESAQEIYRKAFNSAWDQYADPEDRRDDQSREATAHQIAWSAVKNKYEKDENTGKWRKKSE